MAIRIATPVAVMTATAYLVLGLVRNDGDSTSLDASEVQAIITDQFDVNVLAFAPIVLETVEGRTGLG